MDIEPQGNYLLDPNKLLTQFNCTICLNQIEDCYITRCGHVYCRKCIQETVNRHHKCPFCNQQLKDFDKDVFKNYHFNSIKKIVQDEREKWQKGYLKSVWKQIEGGHIQEGERQLLQPIQKRIVQQCKKTLLLYRNYILEVYKNQKQAQERKILSGNKNFRNHHDIIKQIHKWLLDNFPKPIISPELLSTPINIDLQLPGNKNHKSTLRLSPVSTIGSIYPHLLSICSELNLRILGPMPDKLQVNGAKLDTNSCIGIPEGKLLKIAGLPLQNKIYCYSFKWQENKITDFYTCKQCNVKWVCENCALHCHAGHAITAQLKNHKANWACCYCASKCECKAINKNSE